MHKLLKKLCIVTKIFILTALIIPLFIKSVSANSETSYIDVGNMKCIPYQSNIKTYYHNFKYDLDNSLSPYRLKSPQNFTIANLHTDNEIYYFSSVEYAYMKKSDFENASAKERKSLFNTYILQVKKEDLSNTKKGNTISLPLSGRGQTFQLGKHGNTIWTNCDAGKLTLTYGTRLYDLYKISNNRYFGSMNYGISEYKMDSQDCDTSDIITTYRNSINREVTKIRKKQRLYFGGKFLSGLKSYIDYDYIVPGQEGRIYKGSIGTLDEVRGTMSLMSGKDVYIVNFTNMARNIKDYLYKFQLKRDYKGNDLCSQGCALYNGYFYEYLNDNSRKYVYIACYSLDGKLQYMKKIKATTDDSNEIEAEGIQIIDGELFIGIKNIKEKSFTIATFVEK